MNAFSFISLLKHKQCRLRQYRVFAAFLLAVCENFRGTAGTGSYENG